MASTGVTRDASHAGAAAETTDSSTPMPTPASTTPKVSAMGAGVLET
jgi:hypothetical protein